MTGHMAKDKNKGKAQNKSQDRDKAGEEEKQEVSSPQLLYRLERLVRLLRAEGHAGGLNPAQWEALRYLSRANRFSNSPIALTAYLDATKGTVSQTVMALERKGLIAKGPREGEKRSIALSLTDAGRASLSADPLNDLVPALDAVGAKGRRRMARAADEIIAAESSRRSLESFGSCPSCRFYREKSGEHPSCMYFEQELTTEDIKRLCVAHVRRLPSPTM